MEAAAATDGAPPSKRARVDPAAAATHAPSPSFTHEVLPPPDQALDPDAVLLPLPREFSAKSFPFELDPFQNKALAAIERGESVLVSAHTSAGKTVVAEYAVAMSLRDKQRVVYTSPIKALSNQKYRELLAAFGGDVGLMTGDVNVNVDASCLVMTTEILRNMLYRGHELCREVKWVVFDEVHYMRDKERGVVWEECIILLPREVRFVFLSATVSNGREFARWIAATHRAPCHLITTPHRPTPLQHWVYPLGGDGLHLLVDEAGCFDDGAFEAASAALLRGGAEQARARGARLGSRSSPDLLRLLKLLFARDLTPAIVFTFSRKECEGAAMSARKMEPLADEQRDAVRLVFDAAISTLAAEDQSIKQVGMLLPLLERGVAVHHSGMLPVLREVVEILFQEGLVKLLFATETFAMGVNMPARTVVFTSLRKWDGETHRAPSSSEYIQMSGRAGRRGLDARGVVVLMMAEEMERDELARMMKGEPAPLSSSFRLRYNTLLRLYTIETLQPETLVRQSFYAFQRAAQIPAVQARRATLLDEAASMAQPDDDELRRLLALRTSRRRLEDQAHAAALRPASSLRFLQPGRLARVVQGDGLDRGWGVVLSFRHEYGRLLSSELVASSAAADFIVDVLLPCARGASAMSHEGATAAPPPAALMDPEAEAHVLPVRLNLLTRLSAARLWLPADLTTAAGRATALDALRQLVAKEERLGTERRRELACLDPLAHLGATEDGVAALVSRAAALRSREEELEAGLRAGAAAGSIDERLRKLAEKGALEAAARACDDEAVRLASNEFAEQTGRMQTLLRRLGHMDAENVVQLKGRAAAEIDSCDELIAAELLLNGTFNELPPAAAVALCACLIAEQVDRVKKAQPVHADLMAPYQAVCDHARALAAALNAARIPTDERDFVARFDGSLINVVYAWANGATFEALTGMCDLFEGSIIRAIRRLSELIDEMQSAAKAIGNDDLFKTFDDGAKLIRRDIVFAASLYVEA